MSNRQLDDWLKAYMEYSYHLEAPDEYHFWSGISAIAGVLRRRVWLDQFYFKWTPNFYIILVGPSGMVTKTVSITTAMKLLREVKGVHFGPNTLTWQSLITKMQAVQDSVLLPDGMSFEHMACLTFAASELGNLLNPKDREMVDVLTDLWDGRSEAWEKMTKKDGSETILNPWINMIAGTTPSWIAENMPKSVVGGGFTSRCIFIYADRKRKLVAYPRFAMPDQKHYEDLREKLIHDLNEMALMIGEYELLPETVAYGEEWYESIHGKAAELNFSMQRFDGYVARKQGHAHKLAMVLAAARHQELVIYPDDLKHAVRLVEAQEAAMPLVFRHIGMNEDMDKIDAILSAVRSMGRVNQFLLYRAVFNKYGMSKKEFDDYLQSAYMAGELEVVTIDNELMVVAKSLPDAQHEPLGPQDMPHQSHDIEARIDEQLAAQVLAGDDPEPGK